MHKRFLLVIAGSILIAVGFFIVSFGAVKTVFSTKPQINIPPKIEKIVPQKDLVELVCYETKWRGGKAIGRLEAIDKALKPILDETKNLGVEIEPDLYLVGKKEADKLNQKIEAVCQAKSLSQAKQKLQEFISQAQEMKQNIQNGLALKIRNKIEPALRKAGQELKAKIEKELRQQAEEEAKQIKERYRKQIKAEAEQRKNEILQRIKARIKSQMEQEFKAKMNPNGDNSALIAQLREKGEKLGREEGAKEGEKIKAELEAKYRKIAKQEEEKLKEKYKKLGEKIAAEKKEQFEDIAKKLSRFGEYASKTFSQINTEKYQEYKQKALAKRKEIIAKAVGYYIDQAKRLIENQRPLLEAAQKEKARISGKYRILSPEGYLKELDHDKELIVAELTNPNSTKTIAQIEQEFRQKWEKIRKELEMAKMLAQQDILKMIKQKTNWQKVLANLNKWQKFLALKKKTYQTNYLNCQKGIKTTKDCLVCPIIDTEKQLAQEADKIEKEIINAKKLIEKIDYYSNRQASLEELIKLKDDLVFSLGTLRNKKQEFVNIYNQYNNKVSFRRKYCSNK